MKNFDDFQLKEYERIVEAHFKTADAISSFFRYYLVIMALPATAAVLLSGHDEIQSIVHFPSALSETLLGLVLLVVACIGYCLMLYLSNLRMDGLLYARTVNGIRKYFYDSSDAPIAKKQRMRILPQTPHTPTYLELRYFGPVVLAFLLLDTSYFVAGFLLVGYRTTEDFIDITGPFPWEILTASFLFSALHVVSYRSLAKHREHTYLQRASIGIDIDGVLNTHREHFCELLEAKTSKRVSPEAIKTLPVRDTAELQLTLCDEFTVFHDVHYWTEMPPITGAAAALRELRNSMNMKVYIFSYRPWPVPAPDCPSSAHFDLERWHGELKHFRRDNPLVTNKNRSSDPERSCWLPRNPTERVRHWFRDVALDAWRAFYVRLPCAHLIDRITHIWLYKNSMQYDRLVIEKGHTHLSSQSARFINRFNMSTQHNICYFVEDDLEKAVKMAYICDVVFLIEHPYNSDSKIINHDFGQIPSNIVRVKSWDEIRREMRRLL